MVLETLRRARREYKYTAKEMARILGISESYYYQIENGKRKLDYIMAVRISAVFKLKPDDMFYYYFKDCSKENKQTKKQNKLSIKFFVNS